jgi:predicted nucleotidyltransferase
MEAVLKECKPMGNSAAVYVPKEWENKKVLVRLLSPREMALEALQEHMPYVMGAYLYGSYVREEETPESDIDVLVVASRKFEVRKQHLLDVVVVTPSEVDSLLEKDPVQLTPILAEAQPLLNDALLQDLKDRSIDSMKYMKLVRDNSRILKENEELIETKARIGAVIYSLMIRMKAVYLVKKLLSSEKYTAKGYKQYLLSQGLDEEGYEGLNKVYRAIRDDKSLPSGVVELSDIKVLQHILEGENNSLKEILEDGKKKQANQEED